MFFFYFVGDLKQRWHWLVSLFAVLHWDPQIARPLNVKNLVLQKLYNHFSDICFLRIFLSIYYDMLFVSPFKFHLWLTPPKHEFIAYYWIETLKSKI
jgi:hypothetical protein